MIRLLCAAACLLLVACTTKEERIKSSLDLYNGGETKDAIDVLSQAPGDDYAVANLLVIYHVSAGYHGGGKSEFDQADEILKRIEAPKRNAREIGMYLALLHFLSLSNAGEIEGAQLVWRPYCGPFAQTQQHWDCLRLTYITAAALTEGSFPPGTKMNQDLVQMAKAGYRKVYSWDPLVFQSRAEHKAFVERSLKVIEEREAREASANAQHRR